MTNVDLSTGAAENLPPKKLVSDAPVRKSVLNAKSIFCLLFKTVSTLLPYAVVRQIDYRGSELTSFSQRSRMRFRSDDAPYFLKS